MTTIRERVAADSNPPVSQRGQDRNALLAAGDALAAEVRVQHPVSPIEAITGEVIGTWCDGCDSPESECWAVKALARWAEVTGPER